MKFFVLFELQGEQEQIEKKLNELKSDIEATNFEFKKQIAHIFNSASKPEKISFLKKINPKQISLTLFSKMLERLANKEIFLLLEDVNIFESYEIRELSAVENSKTFELQINISDVALKILREGLTAFNFLTKNILTENTIKRKLEKDLKKRVEKIKEIKIIH